MVTIGCIAMQKYPMMTLAIRVQVAPECVMRVVILLVEFGIHSSERI